MLHLVGVVSPQAPSLYVTMCSAVVQTYVVAGHYCEVRLSNQVEIGRASCRERVSDQV